MDVTEDLMREAAIMRDRVAAAMDSVPDLLLDARAFALDDAASLLDDIERDARDAPMRERMRIAAVSRDLSAFRRELHRTAIDTFAAAMGWEFMPGGASIHQLLDDRRDDASVGMDWDHPEAFRDPRHRGVAAIMIHNYSRKVPAISASRPRVREMIGRLAVYRLERSWYAPRYVREGAALGPGEALSVALAGERGRDAAEGPNRAVDPVSAAARGRDRSEAFLFVRLDRVGVCDGD